MRTKVILLTLLVLLALSGGQGVLAESLIVGMEAEVTSLDPFNSTDGVSMVVQRTMYEGLVTFTPDGMIVPLLAEEFYFNDTADAITFVLKKGIKFHDGTELTAEVVKANFDYVLDKENKLARRNFFSFIDEIIINDRYSITFKAAGPDSSMASKFAHTSAGIKSLKFIEQKKENPDFNLDRNACGTGPFKFKEWKSGEFIEVVPFSDYWNKEKLPKVSAIIFKPVPEASTRVNMLKTKEVHFVFPLPTTDAESLANEPGIEVFSGPSVDVFYIGINLQHDKYKDYRVRYAMNHAIDKDQLIAQVLEGYGQIADSPIAPSVYGYTPQSVFEYDPDLAKKLMKEAGYPDGFKATLWTRNATEFIAVAEFVAIQFKEIGIECDVQVFEAGTLFDKLDAGDGTDLWVGRWGPGTGEADYGLRPNFASNRIPPNWNNSGFYVNLTIDRLLDQALRSADTYVTLEKYAEAQKIIYEDAPWVFLYVPDIVAAKRSNVHGVYIYPNGSIHLNEAEVK